MKRTFLILTLLTLATVALAQSYGPSQAPRYPVMYDDLRVSPNSLPRLGGNSPTHVIVANDGSATSGTAGVFNGTTSYGTVADYADLDVDDMTLAMWLHLDDVVNNEIIDRDGDGGFEFYVSNGSLTFSPDGNATTAASGIIAGATQLVVVTVEDTGSSVRVRLYIDGAQVANQLKVGSQLAASAYGLRIGEWHGDGWNLDGIIDDIQMYNIVLTAAQVTEMYNGGSGLTSLNAVPTGVTPMTDLVVRFQNTATDISAIGVANSSVMVLNDVTLDDGLLGVTSGSFGVSALSFPDSTIAGVFFTAQLPHSYYEGEDITFHVHWQTPPGSGEVVWGLEWKWINVGASGTGNTTVSTAAITAVPGYHTASTIVTLDGTGMGISSILVCRLFRDGIDVLDTFVGQVYLSEADFHFPMDSEGSRQEWVK